MKTAMEPEIGRLYRIKFHKWAIMPENNSDSYYYLSKKESFLLLGYEKKEVNYSGFDLVEYTLVILLNNQKYTLCANLEHPITKTKVEDVFELVC